MLPFPMLPILTTYFKLLILRTMDNFKIGDELNVQLISNILDGSGNLLQISNYFTMKGCTEKEAILDFSFANIAT